MHANGSRIVMVASVVSGLVRLIARRDSMAAGKSRGRTCLRSSETSDELAAAANDVPMADCCGLARLRHLERRVGPTFAPWVFIEIHRGERNNCVTTTRGYILYKAYEYARENGIQRAGTGATGSWILADMTNVTLPFPCSRNVIIDKLLTPKHSQCTGSIWPKWV